MPSTSIIIKELKDLEKLELIEEDLISSDPTYAQWEKHCQRIYTQTVEANNLEFRPYQYRYAAMYCTRRNNLNSGSMGTGKTMATAVAIAAVYRNLELYRPGTIHIVVPNGLAAARWVEDLNRISQLRGNYQLVTKSRELPSAEKPILIYNLDFLRNQMPKRAGVKTKPAAKYMYKYLRPNWLIVDESHEIGDRSKRAQLLAILRRRAKRYMEISGTVSDGSVQAVYVALKRIYREEMPYSSYEQMKAEFASNRRITTNYLTGSIDTGRERWVEGLNADKLPDYYQLMRQFMHRVRLSDPEVSDYVTIPTELVKVHKLVPSREMRLEYVKLVRASQMQMQALIESQESLETRAASLRLLHPLIKLVNSPTQDIPSTKVERLKEIIEAAEGKVGIFVDRRLSGDHLLYALREYNPDYLSAELTPEQRVEAVQRFQLSQDHKVTILSINLASASIDLTAGTDTIFYCLPWKFRSIRQAAARMVRPGNKHSKVNIHYVCHIGLVDEHQYALAESRLQGSRLVNDFELMESNEVEEVMDKDLSPLNALRQIMQSLALR